MAIKWRPGIVLDLDIDPNQDDAYYRLDWSDWLQEIDIVGNSDVISSTSVNPESGLAIAGLVFDATTVTFRVTVDTGNLPTVGDVKKIECTITTVNGQKKTRSFSFKIADL